MASLGASSSRELLVSLRGAGGEPVDLARTIYSHGMVSLPPMTAGESGAWLEVTLTLPRGKPRYVRIEPSGRTKARVVVPGRAPGQATARAIADAVRHVLRLDEDLSGFYDLIAEDPDLAWAARGAGRMVRSQTVFEDVVKTICTTNCAWSATERMVGAMVEHLGEPSIDGKGRAFPTPVAIAEAGEDFFRDVARAGYRGPYFVALAERVATGDLDLEAWGRAAAEDLPDDELADRLLALPGVGPYACAHIMLMLGRYSRPILDSWTRPKYARLVGRTKVADRTIERRFARFGRFRGLAFWLFCTQDWLEE